MSSEEISRAYFDTNQAGENNVVNFYPAFTYQRITGFGGAMTEAAACTLSKLSDSDRDAALKDYFGEDGSGYWLFIGTAATILKL